MKSEKRAYRIWGTGVRKMDQHENGGYVFHPAFDGEGLFGPRVPKPTVRKLKRKRAKAARKANR